MIGALGLVVPDLHADHKGRFSPPHVATPSATCASSLTSATRVIAPIVAITSPTISSLIFFLDKMQIDLQYIKEDINAVERHRIELYHARGSYSVKLRILGDYPSTRKAWPSLLDKNKNGLILLLLLLKEGHFQGVILTK